MWVVKPKLFSNSENISLKKNTVYMSFIILELKCKFI